MTALWQLSALELAECIRSGDVTSRDVVEAHLARIDQVNPHVNAIVRRFDGDALAASDRADEAVRSGAVLGRFHGVPYTIKESIDLAGTPTTHGTPMFADAISPTDAPSAGRLRNAGAIPIGRTNVPDLGLRVHTDSTLHGLTLNPWHPGRTAGGSSGGEAAALASGMSALGIGNDIGGSVRNPAHCCGVVSIKPTIGVVPMASFAAAEGMSLAAQQMVAEGPMARRVADVRAALLVIAGPDVRDPRSVPANLTELGHDERLRVAVLAEPPGGDTHPEIAAAVRSAATILERAGHSITEVVPPSYDDVLDFWGRLLVNDIALQRPRLDAVMGEAGRRILDDFQAGNPVPTLESMATLQSSRFTTMQEWSEFFSAFPVLLTPTWAQPAFENGADLRQSEALRHSTLRPVHPANFLGIPAAVVPHGTADGLPVGVQIMGDRFTDLRCLDIAEQIEAGTPRITPIDPVQ